MVSNRFAGKATIKLPAVCHKEIYDLPDVYEGLWPTQLAALAVWKDCYLSVELAESFALTWDATIPGWSGESGQTGWNLAVEIEVTAVHETLDFHLSLRLETATVDVASWNGVLVTPPRPFNSGLLSTSFPWPDDYQELHVLN